MSSSSSSSSAILVIKRVTKRYGARTAVDAASLSLARGEIVCLLGPSGCGKSTLLRLAAGLEPVDDGEILASGCVLSARGMTAPPEDRGIGVVFQDFALFPHLTVIENVSFGIARLGAAERSARALSLLAMFNMQDRADAYPHMLSGGEQQRVAIARSLARQPSAILLDEPFSGLDGHLKSEVRRTVLAGLREAGASVIVVTHDPEEAITIADRLALMLEGRILQTGTAVDCYLQPASIAVARLLGETNVIPVRVSGGYAHSPFGILKAPDIADGEALAMIRPEAFSLTDDGGAEVTVRDVRFTGANYEVELAAAGLSVRMRLSGGSPPSNGAARVRIEEKRARIFPRG